MGKTYEKNVKLKSLKHPQLVMIDVWWVLFLLILLQIGCIVKLFSMAFWRTRITTQRILYMENAQQGPSFLTDRINDFSHFYYKSTFGCEREKLCLKIVHDSFLNVEKKP